MTRTLFLLLLWASAAHATANVWQQLSPTPTAHWVPATLFDCTNSVSSPNPQGRSFSGSNYGNGQIYYWGGGHNSYPGNDMEVYDIATNRWLPDTVQPQCWAPCCAAAYSCGGGLLGGDQYCDNYPIDCSGSLDPYSASCQYGSCVNYSGKSSKGAFRCSGGSRDGQTCTVNGDCPSGTCPITIPTPGTTCTTCKPYTEHTYQKEAYNPNTGHDFFVIDSGTWDWNPSTRAWTWLGPPAPQSADFSNRLVIYDPTVSKMLYIQAGGGNRGVYRFNDSTNAWTLADTYLPTNAWTGLFATWDASVSKFVVVFMPDVNPFQWYLYDPTQTGAGAWTSLTTPSALTTYMCGGTASRPCFTSSVVYDGTNQRTIALTLDASNNFALYALNAGTQTWSAVTTTGGTSTWGFSGNQTGGYNTIHYDGPTGSLYLLDAGIPWECGSASAVKMWTVQLDLGNPLPTNTPANTATPTPTQPTPTPTATFPTYTPTAVPATYTPTNTPLPTTPTATPTCVGTVRLVGPGRTYTTVNQATAVVQSNDCVYIDAGTYYNADALGRWPATASNVTVRGSGGMARLMINNGDINTGMGGDTWKGIFVANGANLTVENIEFDCASSRPADAFCTGPAIGAPSPDYNYAGIRLQAAGLTVRNCIFRQNDNSILGGPTSGSPAGDVLIENSEFNQMGYGDGSSHGFYLNARNNTLTYRYNWAHNTIMGHHVKSRAVTNYVLYNRIMDQAVQTASCNDAGTCSASVEVELPCGGLSYVIGNALQKSVTADNNTMVNYAAEVANVTNCPFTNTQELYVINNTLVSDYGPTTKFIRGAGTSPLVWAVNNIFWGAGTVLTWPSGGTQANYGNSTDDPKLQDQSLYDFHLTANSTAVQNIGVNPLTDDHGYSLIPTRQYVYDRASMARPDDGLLDLGAFEYGYTPPPTPTPRLTAPWLLR